MAQPLADPLKEITWAAVTRPDLAALARRLSRLLYQGAQHGQGARIYLCGALGAGKTTFCQLCIGELCGVERAPSPSYSLVHPYRVTGIRTTTLYHMDCYRLGSGAELADLALDDLDAPEHVLLVEWPEHVSGALPPVDLWVTMAIRTQATDDPDNAPRTITMGAFSQRAALLLSRLQQEAATQAARSGTIG